MSRNCWNRCLRKEPGRPRPEHGGRQSGVVGSEGGLGLRQAIRSLANPSGEGAPGSPRFGLWAAAGAAVLALAGLSVWLSSLREPRATANHRPPDDLSRFGTLPQFLARDGNQVAFSWDGEQLENFDIYIQQVGEAPRRCGSPPTRHGTLIRLGLRMAEPLPSHGFSPEARR